MCILEVHYVVDFDYLSGFTSYVFTLSHLNFRHSLQYCSDNTAKSAIFVRMTFANLARLFLFKNKYI